MELLDLLLDGRLGATGLALGIVLGTWVQEDLALAVAGGLSAQGHVRLPLALAAGLAGVVAMDAFVYLVGRVVGRRVLDWRPVRRVLGHRGEDWFARHGFAAVLLCRALPGTRTAVHLAAGAFDMPFRSFLLSTVAGGAAAVCVVVGLGYLLGPWVVAWFEAVGAHPLLALVAGLLVVVGLTQGLPRLVQRRRPAFFEPSA